MAEERKNEPDINVISTPTLNRRNLDPDPNPNINMNTNTNRSNINTNVPLRNLSHDFSPNARNLIVYRGSRRGRQSERGRGMFYIFYVLYVLFVNCL